MPARRLPTTLRSPTATSSEEHRSGLRLRAEALNRHTERLPLVNVETPGDVALWGTDTPRAITAGIVRGVAGEIDYYRRMLPDDAAVILTGGDAVRLAPFVPQHHAAEVIVEPALVVRAAQLHIAIQPGSPINQHSHIVHARGPNTCD